MTRSRRYSAAMTNLEFILALAICVTLASLFGIALASATLGQDPPVGTPTYNPFPVMENIAWECIEIGANVSPYDMSYNRFITRHQAGVLLVSLGDFYAAMPGNAELVAEICSALRSYWPYLTEECHACRN